MRRLLPFLLVLGLVLPAAAWALRAAPGDGTLVVENGRGSVVVRARGGIIGRFDSGRLVVDDPADGDGAAAIVYGAERIREVSAKRTLYIGEDVRFRIIGGFYRVQIRRSGSTSARSAAARSRSTASGFTDQPGRFAIDGAPFQSLPGVSHPVHARAALARLAEQVSARGTQTVLVVEDESSIASFVALYLKNAGFAVRTAANGSEALAQAAAAQPALIVLDLMLPDIDGIEVCRRIRKASDVPILMLTARDEDVDKIIGLEVGADDYLTKPFNPRELVARVKSILRRAAPERRQMESKQLRHGELLIDAGRREVRVGEEEIQLAPKEFDLLWELLDHRGLVLTRDQLLERVWGYTFAGDTRTVDVHVRQLRRKLGDASPIVTVWGVGYKVTPAKDAARLGAMLPVPALPPAGVLPGGRRARRDRLDGDRGPALPGAHPLAVRWPSSSARRGA